MTGSAWPLLLHLSPNGMLDFIRVLLSVLIPPLGVFFKVGIGVSFWVNILLTILGYIPGLVHAIWILASRRS